MNKVYYAHATSPPVSEKFCNQAICLQVIRTSSAQATNLPVGKKFCTQATCLWVNKEYSFSTQATCV